MDDLRAAKSELRRRMRALLRSLPGEKITADSEAVAQRVLALPAVQRAACVFCYVSMPQEVATHALIQRLLAAGKTLAVPRIAGDRIEAHLIQGLAELAPTGSYGILEPTSSRPLTRMPDVTLTPGLAFSARGDRLGRGRAYYDGFLAEHSATAAVALAFEEQVVDRVPTNDNDRRVNWIVTPRRVIACTGLGSVPGTLGSVPGTSLGGVSRD